MNLYRKMQPLLLLAFMTSLPTASSFAVRTTDGTSRRDFLQNVAITSSAAVYIVASNPGIGNAAYGDSSNIVMPNYIEYLIEKNKQVDPSKFTHSPTASQFHLRRHVTPSNNVSLLSRRAKNPQMIYYIKGQTWSFSCDELVRPRIVCQRLLLYVKRRNGVKCKESSPDPWGPYCKQ